MSDWKKDTRTPEEQANDVPVDVGERWTRIQEAERWTTETIIREQVIPRDELIEELVKQLQFERDEWHKLHDGNCETLSTDELLAKAHSHGYGKPPMTP